MSSKINVNEIRWDAPEPTAEEAEAMRQEFIAKEQALPAPGILKQLKNAVVGTGQRMAAGVNTGMAGITKGLTDIGQMVGKPLGIPESEALRQLVETYAQGAEYWRNKPEAQAVSGVPGKVYEGMGAAPAGIAEFMAGVPYAAAKGAATEGMAGAAKGAVERAVLGKIFKAMEAAPIPQVAKTATMAGVGGAQTAAEGGSPEDIVAAATTMAALSTGGRSGKEAEVYKNLVKGGVPSSIAGDLAQRSAKLSANLKATAEETKAPEGLNDSLVFSVSKSDLTPKENAFSTANTEKYLRVNGIPFRRVKGMYEGAAEESFVVPNLPEYKNVVSSLAKKFNQDSVLIVDAKGNSQLAFKDGTLEKLPGAMKEVSKEQASKLTAYTHDAKADKYYSNMEPEVSETPLPLTEKPAEIYKKPVVEYRHWADELKELEEKSKLAPVPEQIELSKKKVVLLNDLIKSVEDDISLSQRNLAFKPGKMPMVEMPEGYVWEKPRYQPIHEQTFDTFSADYPLVEKGREFVRDQKGKVSYAGLETEATPADKIAAAGAYQPAGNIQAGSLPLNPEMKLPKYAGNINLEKVDAGYPVKKLILDTADQYKGFIDEARRGQITQRETRSLADDLGMTVEKLLKRQKGQAYNAEEAVAARDLLNTSATNLRMITEEAAKLGTDESLANFRLAMSRHAAVQAEVSGVAAEAGRALQAHNIMSEQSKNYKAMLDALGGREVSEDILHRFAQVDVNNVQEVNKFVKQFATIKKTDMIYEAWMNFILSGPKTHIVNAVSNTLTYMTKPAEQLFTAMGEAIRSTVTGKPREHFFSESTGDITGAVFGIKEGVQAALKAWKEEMPSDALIKMENMVRTGAIPGKTGEVIRTPGRALLAADEFFKSINYSAEIYRSAWQQAMKEKTPKADFVNRVANIVQNPTETMMIAARKEAAYRTFTDPLGKAGNAIIRARDTIPGAKYIVPFVRTPANIAKFALERTPLNFVRLGVKVAKGELSGVRLSEELAKPMIGTAIAAAVIPFVLEGKITGGGPKDKAEREMLQNTGWQPYAFKLGDKYLSYGRLEPIGSIFGMSADFVDLINSGEASSKEISDYAEGIAMSVSKNLTSKTFMKGVSSAVDAMSDPKRYGASFIENMAGSVVPSMVNSVAQMTDETQRLVEGPGAAILSRLPYLSRTLFPSRDIWGREKSKIGSAAERGFSPAPVTEESKDPVVKEVARLGLSLGMPAKKIRNVELSPAQYDIFVRRAGELAYATVNQIVAIPMNDEVKKDVIRKLVERSRLSVANELLASDNIREKFIKLREDKIKKYEDVTWDDESVPQQLSE